MGIKQNIFRNVIVRWLHYVIFAVVSFLMLPFIINKLGDSVYGVWLVIGSLTGYLMLLDFGVGLSLVKYIAEFKAKNDEEKLKNIIGNGLSVYSLIGAVSFVVTVVFIWIFPRFFDTAGLDVKTVQRLIGIVGLQISIGFPMAIFSGILKGYNRYDLDSIVHIITIIARTALLIIFLNLGYSVLSVAVIMFVSNMLGHLTRFMFSVKLIKNIRLICFKFQRADFKLILRYSFYTFLTTIAVRLVFYTDSMVIGAFISAAAVTVYSIGSRLVEYTREVVSLMANVTMPVASGFGADGIKQRNQKLLEEGTKYCWILTLFLISCLVFFGRSLIYLWVGPKYSVSYTILLLLIIPELIALSQSVSVSILYGLAKHKIFAIVSATAAIANLILSIILVKIMGITGVALATTVSYTIFSLYIPVYTCKQLEFSLISYLRKSYLKPLIGALPFFVFLLAVSRFPIDSVFKLFITGGFGFLIYAAGITVVCFESVKNLLCLIKEPVKAKIPIPVLAEEQTAEAEAEI